MRKHADKGFKKGPKKYWPAWRTNAAGDSRIFEKPEDVPEGWFATHAEAVAYAETPAAPPPPPPPAPKALKKGQKAEKPAPEKTQREKDVDTLLAAGYDPKELAEATDSELTAAVKGLANGNAQK